MEFPTTPVKNPANSAAPAAFPAKRRQGGGFLIKPATTTLSLESDLLSAITRSALAANLSNSRWLVEAAKAKLRREQINAARQARGGRNGK